jgi:hypothetical protein
MNATIRIKRFVKRNKKGIIVGLLLTPVIITQHGSIKRMNAFLDSKELSEEYYLNN